MCQGGSGGGQSQGQNPYASPQSYSAFSSGGGAQPWIPPGTGGFHPLALNPVSPPHPAPTQPMTGGADPMVPQQQMRPQGTMRDGRMMQTQAHQMRPMGMAKDQSGPSFTPWTPNPNQP